MLNPLRSEDEAFRLLLYVLARVRAIVVRDRCDPAARSSERACEPAGAASRLERTPPARAGYLTVSVPYIPAARWPGAWQKNV